MPGDIGTELLVRPPQEKASPPQTPIQVIKEHMREKHARGDQSVKITTDRWVDNPVYPADELGELARKQNFEPEEEASNGSVDAFMHAINDNVFGGRPPSETGYAQTLSKERGGVGGILPRFTQNLSFYRLPMVENPQNYDDYLYMSLTSRGTQIGLVATGFVEENGERRLTALRVPTHPSYKPGTPGVSTIPYGRNGDMSFANDETLNTMILSLRKDENLLEPAKSALPPGK